MVWKKILNFHSIGFGTFLLVFAFALFFSFFLDIHNSFAVDDVVLHVTQDTEVGSGIDLCSSVEVCSQYSYFIYKPIDVSNYLNNSYSEVSFRTPNAFRSTFSKGFSTSVFTFSSVSRIYLFAFGNMSQVSSFSFDLILTNSPEDYVDYISSDDDCPVCEECQVCPVIPENPYDDKFDKLITAVYVCAATLLVIYFFYCIYRMIIKSTGGK